MVIMPRKAQAEIALILGLLVIAVAIGLYSYSSLSPPSVENVALTQEQQSVASFVKDVMRQGVSETVSEIYKNGGYLDGSSMYLGYTSTDTFGNVAFWQMCDTFAIPDIKANLADGVKKYLEENLPDTQSIGGRTATFNKDAMQVTTKLYDNKVVVAASIPTTFEGSQVPQPYRIDFATGLGRIADFAENFAIMEADCRMLDNNLISSLSQSSESSRPCWIPFGMGNAQRQYTFSWTQLRDCMELHARNSVATTKVGYQIPTDTEGRLVNMRYSGWDGTSMEFGFIPTIIDYSSLPEGQRACGENAPENVASDPYNDLNVMFYYGDDDGLDRTEFSAPETLEIKRASGSVNQYLNGFTIAQYQASYNVKYPVVVSIWDDDMKMPFNFAVMVFMENNQVGHGCTASSAIPPAPQTLESLQYNDRCRTGATEDASIMVKYTDGSIVKGAKVSFDGCPLGNTANDGFVSGKVPKTALGSLTVEVDDNVYTEAVSYSELAGHTFSIPKSKSYTFHFYKVPVTKTAGGYTAEAPVPVSGEKVSMYMERTDFDPFDTSGITQFSATEPSKFIYRLPMYEYNVTAGLNTEEEVLGIMNGIFTPAPDTEDVYVYIPSLSGIEDADVENLKSLYDNCNGLSLISNGQISYTGGCSWTG